MARLFGTFLPASEFITLSLSRRGDVVIGRIYRAVFPFVKNVSERLVGRERTRRPRDALFSSSGSRCFNDTFIIVCVLSYLVTRFPSSRLFPPIFSQIAVVFTIDSRFSKYTRKHPNEISFIIFFFARVFNFQFRPIQFKLRISL